MYIHCIYEVRQDEIMTRCDSLGDEHICINSHRVEQIDIQKCRSDVPHITKTAPSYQLLRSSVPSHPSGLAAHPPSLRSAMRTNLKSRDRSDTYINIFNTVLPPSAGYASGCASSLFTSVRPPYSTLRDGSVG